MKRVAARSSSGRRAPVEVLECQPLHAGDQEHRRRVDLALRRTTLERQQQLAEDGAEVAFHRAHDRLDLVLHDRLRGKVEVDTLKPGITFHQAPDARDQTFDEFAGISGLRESADDLLDDELADLACDGGDKSLLRAEVVGDQRLVLTRSRRDLGQRQTGVAVLLEDIQPGLEDPLRCVGGRSAWASGGCLVGCAQDLGCLGSRQCCRVGNHSCMSG